MANLKLSIESLTSGDFCKNCTYSQLQGSLKAGPGRYEYFCIYEENLIEVENFVEGIKIIYAPPCYEINDNGSCMDYQAS